MPYQGLLEGTIEPVKFLSTVASMTKDDFLRSVEALKYFENFLDAQTVVIECKKCQTDYDMDREEWEKIRDTDHNKCETCGGTYQLQYDDEVKHGEIASRLE